MSEPGPDPIDIAVGARIRVRRLLLGVSQSQLADHLGVTFQQVQKYERGTNRISASMLVRAAERLDATVGALVGEGDQGEIDDPVFRLLCVPGSTEILAAFGDLSVPRRRSLIELARAMTTDDD